MAYDEDLAHRVRAALSNETGLTEKAMFGGVGFMLDGHMALAASSTGGLMVRVDPREADDLVDGRLVVATHMRGRELRGWLDVRPDAVRSDAELSTWVRRGAEFVRTLPPKQHKRRS